MLRTEIVGLTPGERLPGMHELCRRYDVSINTVGMALALLEQGGIVVRRNGNGVFVAEQANRRRIGILSELDLFDPRIGPHWRSVAGNVKAALETAGHVPHLYVGNAHDLRVMSPICSTARSPCFFVSYGIDCPLGQTLLFTRITRMTRMCTILVAL